MRAVHCRCGIAVWLALKKPAEGMFTAFEDPQAAGERILVGELAGDAIVDTYAILVQPRIVRNIADGHRMARAQDRPDR